MNCNFSKTWADLRAQFRKNVFPLVLNTFNGTLPPLGQPWLVKYVFHGWNELTDSRKIHCVSLFTQNLSVSTGVKKSLVNLTPETHFKPCYHSRCLSYSKSMGVEGVKDRSFSKIACMHLSSGSVPVLCCQTTSIPAKDGWEKTGFRASWIGVIEPVVLNDGEKTWVQVQGREDEVRVVWWTQAAALIEESRSLLPWAVAATRKPHIFTHYAAGKGTLNKAEAQG